jgi:hypothetical protein
MLIAQAQLEDVAVVSDDEVFDGLESGTATVTVRSRIRSG